MWLSVNTRPEQTLRDQKEMFPYIGGVCDFSLPSS